LTTSTLTPSMETGSRGGGDLLKSTTISLVLVVFSCRWFCLHHCTKLSTRLLYSPCTRLTTPTTRSHATFRSFLTTLLLWDVSGMDRRVSTGAWWTTLCSGVSITTCS